MFVAKLAHQAWLLVPAPHKVIKLPALSPTMEQGTIVSWDKQEGDEVEEGDIIAQVETDKAVMDMETTESGFIAKKVD